MRKKLVFFILSLGLLSAWGCQKESLHSAGTLFLRQSVDHYKVFHGAFLDQGPNLKANGFLAYSLHQDAFDPKAVIVTLKCSDLQKGLDFVRSDYFLNAMNKAGCGIPEIWYGLDITDRAYQNEPKMAGGIVIARNEVRSFKIWKKSFDAEGPHHHANRRYVASNRTVHYCPALGGGLAAAIVVHNASDIKMAPAFMDSESMRGEMEAMGVEGLEIWYGKNLEQGLF